nr:glycoside hydrolase family 97 protein [uncultured Pedobacter sp.]
MKKSIIIFTIVFLAINRLCAQQIVVSPNGKIKFTIDAVSDGAIVGKITFNNEGVLNTQLADFSFNNQPDLKNNLVINGSSAKTVNEEWTPVLKRFEKVKNYCNEITIDLQEKAFPKRKLQIIARAYDDGVAYRTRFLGPDNGLEYSIREENSAFNFSGDRTCWVADHENFSSPQESFFYKRNLSDINPKMLVGLPITIQASEKCFVAITEADLTDYAGMYLKKADENQKFSLRTTLSPSVDSAKIGKVTRKLPFNTPWRVVIIGDTPGKLIESEMVTNLSPPCAIEDPSWIKPGISAWDNWFSNDVKMEEGTIKQFIDLASEMTWPYMIVDWQWYGKFNSPQADITKSAPQINMQNLLAYAKSKNVRLILWLYWTDVNRSDWEKVCALYEKWGVAGVKIDFMNRDDQEMVNWYERTVKTAAKHKLMVDFHGAYKPTGIRRTYPNLVTREGVMGNEWNKWSTMITPEHICTLPFTRMVAGPMDFTPGCFENRTPEDFKIQSPTNTMVTRSNSLAQFVVFDSPLTVACDHPDNYRGQVGSDFLAKVKTTWDDTKVINGAVGEYITMARRTGNTWFIGALNGSSKKTLDIKLDFLGKGKFKLVSYEDGLAPDKAVKKEQMVNNTSEVKLVMAAGGGYAAYIQSVN